LRASSMPCNFLPVQLSNIAAALHVEDITRALLQIDGSLREQGLEVVQGAYDETGVEERTLTDIGISLRLVWYTLLQTGPEGLETRMTVERIEEQPAWRWNFGRRSEG
jgi:hypothetical protein